MSNLHYTYPLPWLDTLLERIVDMPRVFAVHCEPMGGGYHKLTILGREDAEVWIVDANNRLIF